MSDPNDKLPEELQHRQIRGVRGVGVTRESYQVVFDQPYMPHDWFGVTESERWWLHHARVEYHSNWSGILRFLFPAQPCLTVVVTEHYPETEPNND